MSTVNLKTIGKNCKRYRMYIGCSQNDVAIDVGYSVENISAFENGRNDNLRILIWYLKKGVTTAELLYGSKIYG